ncbi:MAG: aminopeptidase P family protein [Bacteroidales bacterium]|nr:aminopeptidase P family protein [Bacteroidales bacterium]
MNPLFNSSVYAQRREKLAKQVNSGIILFLGNNEAPMNYNSNCYRYRQDSSFLYFFGLATAGLSAIIDIDENKTIIFGDDFTIDDIIWVGNQPAIRTLAEQVAVKETMSTDKLADYLSKNSHRKIHYTLPYRHDNQIVLSRLLNIPVQELGKNISVELTKTIVALRSIKEDCEIAEMEKACNIAHEMHSTVIKSCKLGVSEQYLMGLAEGISLQKGNGPSFQIILTQHGEIFHNLDHNVDLQKGRLLLMDAGAENPMNYCSDTTRTMPVGGKFTSKQQDIYEIVLKGNMCGIDMVKAGIPYRDVHFAVAEIVAQGLKDLGLMKGDVKEAVQLGAHALFFPHGLGHMVGLDVHDMENLGEDFVGYNDTFQRSNIFGTRNLRMARTLEPNMVITVEPGIYFIPQLIEMWKNENHLTDFINYDKVAQYLDFGGIRIEDCVCVKENGHKILGPHLPKAVDELTALMS